MTFLEVVAIIAGLYGLVVIGIELYELGVNLKNILTGKDEGE